MGLSAFNRRRRAEANKAARVDVADTPVVTETAGATEPPVVAEPTAVLESPDQENTGQDVAGKQGWFGWRGGKGKGGGKKE